MRLLCRHEPASRAIWAARTPVNAVTVGRTHGGAWDGGGEAQGTSLMMRQIDYVHRGDEYMPSTLKNAHFYALDIKILPAAHRRRAPAPARGPFSFLVHPRANRPARKRGFREMRGEIIVLQEVKDQRREKSIKENALFQASNRRFSPAGAAAALWAQRAHPGGTRGLLLVQLRANRLPGVR